MLVSAEAEHGVLECLTKEIDNEKYRKVALGLNQPISPMFLLRKEGRVSSLLEIDFFLASQYGMSM